MQVLIAHHRVDALTLLVDLGMDLRRHMHVAGVDGANRNVGVGQLVFDSNFYLLAFSQMVHHGWSIDQCLASGGAASTDLFVKDPWLSSRSTSEPDAYLARNASGDPCASHSVEHGMQRAVGMALRMISASIVHSGPEAQFEEDANEVASEWRLFRAKLQANEATSAEVQAFCDEVLWPELVTVRFALEYSMQRHGAKPRDEPSEAGQDLDDVQYELHNAVMFTCRANFDMVLGKDGAYPLC